VIANPAAQRALRPRQPKSASIAIYQETVTIFDQIVAGKADVDDHGRSETLLQQKLHQELCSIHPDKAFNYAEKGYWLQRDVALKNSSPVLHWR